MVGEEAVVADGGIFWYQVNPDQASKKVGLSKASPNVLERPTTMGRASCHVVRRKRM